MYRHITEADHLQKVMSFYADIIIATLKGSLKHKSYEAVEITFEHLGSEQRGGEGGITA